MSDPASTPARPRVVIVGGGFGGLYAAKSLRGAALDVTLVDRRNFHLFQPLLYQVATGGLSPANIAAPLRSVLGGRHAVRVLLAEVTGFDLAARRVRLADGELAYDALLVAAGMRNHYFGNAGWERYAPGLKTIEDATLMRARILSAFERAEREPDPDRRRAGLTFVVVGAGPTGVELAGTLAEIARFTLRREFRDVDPRAARILLVEAGDRVLPGFADELTVAARRLLERLGVEVLLGTMIVGIDADGVTVRPAGAADPDNPPPTRRIEARTTLWAAGVRAAPLGTALAEAAGLETDRLGRVPVEPDCSLAGYPEVFCIGDLARCAGADGAPLPGVAPVAMQQGLYVARILRRGLRAPRVRPFRYVDRGAMATIGRAAAVADIRGWRFSGWPAWLAWLFVHLAFLIEFQNRVLVLLQWSWNYFTWDRSSRLIVGDGGAPESRK